MTRFGSILCILLVSLAFRGVGSTDEYRTVRVQDGRLSLDVVAAPLVEILEDLQAQGIRIQADRKINPKITAEFADRPVEEAFADILKGYGYAIVRENLGDDGESRFAELQIFMPQKNYPPGLDSRGNLQVATGESGRQMVKNILLVRLSDHYTLESFAVLLDKYGAIILDYYKPLRVVRLQLPEGSDPEWLAGQLAEAAVVSAVEPDYVYPLGKGSQVGIPSSADFQGVNPDGAGVPVAVLDSGLAPEYAHSPYVLGTFDALVPGAAIHDNAGHGTQMALIASGLVNPLGVDQGEVSPVLAVRAFDDNGYTSTATLMRAMEYALAAGAGVVSMSWGSEMGSPLLESVMQYGAEKGLILVAAAGNEPTGNAVYPAAYHSVVGVGAVMPDGSSWSQSNYGDFVAVEAPGLANFPVGHNGEPGLYAGTSIATAFTAKKIIEALNANPGAGPQAIIDGLTGAAQQ